MNSTKESTVLIEIPPGRYVRAGPSGTAFKEIRVPTQGLVVVSRVVDDRKFRTVLVDGDLINWWADRSND